MHVVVNVAMSADGKLSTRRREQIKISNQQDFDRVSILRAESDAIVVGVGTVLADDPALCLKDPTLIEQRIAAGKPSQPARVVIDSSIRSPPDSHIFDDSAPTYVLTTESASMESRADIPSDSVEFITTAGTQVNLQQGFAALHSLGIDTVMVEGGGELLFSLFEAGLVDELYTFIGAMIIGGRDAPTLADGQGFLDQFPPLRLREVEQLGDGILAHWDVKME